MTCIVGVKYHNGVMLGGDSAGVDSGFNLSVRKDPKVFRWKDPFGSPVVIGYTSSFRMGQLLRYKLPKELERGFDYKIDPNVDYYMSTMFIDSVRKIFSKEGYARKKNDREEGGFFLVGYYGELYQIECDYQVGKVDCGFDSVGCGAAYSLGFLQYNTPNQEDHLITEEDAKKLIVNALNVAYANSAGITPPYRLIGEYMNEVVVGEEHRRWVSVP